MSCTIMALGHSTFSVNEIYASLVKLVGDVCIIKKKQLKNPVLPDEADLFICGLTQIERASAILPREKIMVAEPRFTADFFIEIAKIPPDSAVGVYHSSAFRVDMIIQGLKNRGFQNLNFIPIAESLPPAVIKERLQRSDYIIGTAPFLTARLKAGSSYRQSLRPEAKIIYGERVSSIESICRIIQWVAENYHAQMQQQLCTIKNHLPAGTGSDQQMLELARQAEQISHNGDELMQKLRSLLFRGFLDQISPHIEADVNLTEEQIGERMAHSLQSIKKLSEDLEQIANALASDSEPARI